MELAARVPARKEWSERPSPPGCLSVTAAASARALGNSGTAEDGSAAALEDRKISPLYLVSSFYRDGGKEGLMRISAC